MDKFLPMEEAVDAARAKLAGCHPAVAAAPGVRLGITSAAVAEDQTMVALARRATMRSACEAGVDRVLVAIGAASQLAAAEAARLAAASRRFRGASVDTRTSAELVMEVARILVEEAVVALLEEASVDSSPMMAEVVGASAHSRLRDRRLGTDVQVVRERQPTGETAPAVARRKREEAGSLLAAAKVAPAPADAHREQEEAGFLLAVAEVAHPRFCRAGDRPRRRRMAAIGHVRAAVAAARRELEEAGYLLEVAEVERPTGRPRRQHMVMIGQVREAVAAARRELEEAGYLLEVAGVERLTGRPRRRHVVVASRIMEVRRQGAIVAMAGQCRASAPLKQRHSSRSSSLSR
jgi:hypothetical protein